MVRFSVVHLLFLVLPFVVYGLYWYFVLRHQNEPGAAARETPWVVLIVSGVALMVASFIVSAQMSGYGPEQDFVPARYENGQLVPGRTEPARP